jgi:lysozyme
LSIDTFVSFAFNLGNNGFVNPKTRAPSKIVAFHNKGDYEAAAGQFEKWVHDNGKVVDGLVTRRKKEEALYRGNV